MQPENIKTAKQRHSNIFVHYYISACKRSQHVMAPPKYKHKNKDRQTNYADSSHRQIPHWRDAGLLWFSTAPFLRLRFSSRWSDPDTAACSLRRNSSPSYQFAPFVARLFPRLTIAPVESLLRRRPVISQLTPAHPPVLPFSRIYPRFPRWRPKRLRWMIASLAFAVCTPCRTGEVLASHSTGVF